jgi:hypothetical protein
MIVYAVYISGAFCRGCRLKVTNTECVGFKFTAFALGFSYHKRLHAVGIENPISFRMRVRYNPSDNTIHKI